MLIMIQVDDSLKKIISEKLPDLLNVFKSNKANNEALGIDIGSSAIKVVQLKKKGGKAILETYGIIALGPYANMDIGSATALDTENLSHALLDVIKESNITTKFTTISVPSLSSLIFTISLPNTVDENNLSTIVPMEARKYIPVPINEVTLDWSIIPQEVEFVEDNDDIGIQPKDSKTIEVLVIAIHNETISQYQELIKKTSLNCESFEMEIFSTIRSSFSNEVAPVMLIDFGASKTKVSIIEAGIVRAFHVVNRGSQDITRNISQSLSIPFPEAEKKKRTVGLRANVDPKIEAISRMSVNYIFSDINSIVFSYEKKYNKNIGKIFLSGGGSLLDGFLEAAKENFKAEVNYVNPFSKVEAPAFLTPVLESSGPEFATSVGLALRQLS